MIGEAGREVATSETEEEAGEVVEAAVALIRRFGDPLAAHDDATGATGVDDAEAAQG